MAETPTEKPNPVGPPLKWPKVEALQAAVDSYFALFHGNESKDHPKYGKAKNLYGLSLHLRISYDALVDYESGKYDSENNELSVPIREARLKCLSDAGENVYAHTAGAVNILTNLSRKTAEPWKNAQSNEVTGANGGPVQIQGIKVTIVDSKVSE